MQVIQTEGLTKYYGRIRGVEDLTLEVNQGEIFGYLGPNGAGKTTTIRLLLNLIFPTRGRARIFGRDIIKESHLIRSNTGYIPGEVHLYPIALGSLYLLAPFYDAKLKIRGIFVTGLLALVFFLAISAYTLFLSLILKERG